MMKKHTKLVRGLTGALSVSALALGLSGTAQAALIAPDLPISGISAYNISASLITGPAGSGVTGTSITKAAVWYNAASGGNNKGSGVNGSIGAAAGPFAPGSSVNITYSRHNLGSGNMIGGNHTSGVLASNNVNQDNAVVGTNQICVFCHTPHGFNTVQSGPLWNKQVSAASTYTVYNAGSNNSSTLDADAPVIGSVSLACLSCHDGTQAMDNMINAPGSGGMTQAYDATLAASSVFNASGVNVAAAGAANGNGNSRGTSQGYIWGNNQGGFAFMSQGGAGLGVGGFNGDNPASEGIDLGTDLSNDHPISVQYCGGGILTDGAGSALGAGAAGIAQGTCNDRLFNLPTVQSMGGQYRFWVDTNVIPDADAILAGAASTGGAGANPITRDPDTLEEYVTTGLTPATANALAYNNAVAGSAVQAGSCGTGTNGDACGRGFISYVKTASGVGSAAQRIAGFGVRTKQDIMLFTNNQGVTGPSVECASCHDPHTPNNGTFLRVSNNNSGLCLSCHVK